ncbi:conserved hypothetical protein [Brochothrix thermosphacta]|nr:hypothetical protein FM106_04835 [Brachybacterium faecium]SPP29941.1 conserved hypothetical protein [Brochothrix thermosphacta]
MWSLRTSLYKVIELHSGAFVQQCTTGHTVNYTSSNLLGLLK